MQTEQMNDMPSEVNEMPQGAQNIFKAAFKSAQEDGMSQQGAMEVAWNSVKRGYEKGADGKWQLIPQVSNQTNKSVQSGGN